MRQLSISELANLAELSRETVRRRLGDMAAENGGQNAKTYPSGPALRAILGNGNSGEKSSEVSASESESRRRLNDAKLAALEFEMQQKQRGFINVLAVPPIVANHLTSIAQIILGWRGRHVSDSDLNQIFLALQDCHSESMAHYGFTPTEIFDLRKKLKSGREAAERQQRQMDEESEARRREGLEASIREASKNPNLAHQREKLETQLNHCAKFDINFELIDGSYQPVATVWRDRAYERICPADIALVLEIAEAFEAFRKFAPKVEEARK